MELYKIFPKIRTVVETDNEIIIKGHCGVVEIDDEVFLKSNYSVHIPLWDDTLDAEIKIFKRN